MNLKYDTNFVDFINIITIFLTSNNRNIAKVQKFQAKKLAHLCSGSSYFESVTLRDPEKIVFNFSDHQLTEMKASENNST